MTRLFTTFAIFAFVLNLAILLAIGYIAYHFLTKVW